MFATIYHGYIGFAMTLFTVVGALSVCVIACIILANTLQELLIKLTLSCGSILMATKRSGSKKITRQGG